jgi:hypothetical protein
MSKSSKLKLIKDYIVKCRLESYMGADMDSVVISTYHTHIIAATSKALAQQEAIILVSAKLNGEGEVFVESCSEGV